MFMFLKSSLNAVNVLRAYLRQVRITKEAVEDESFISNYDVAVSLAHTTIVSGTVVVTTTDKLTTYTENTNYTIDYTNGAITVITTPITDETFTSNYDVAVSLAHKSLKNGSVTVTTTDGLTTYTEGSDYTIDYLNGTITVNTIAVADETFHSNYNNAVALAHNNLKSGSVSVTTTDDATTYAENTDYTIDYTNGTITVLDSGNMANDTDYHINYNYGVMADATAYYIDYRYGVMLDSTEYYITYNFNANRITSDNYIRTTKELR